MKHLLSFIAAVLLFTNLISAQFEFTGAVESYTEHPNRIEFDLTNAKFNLYVYESGIIRFRYTNRNGFDEAPSYAVVHNLPPETDFTFDDGGDDYTLTTNELIVKISKSPCRVNIYDKDMNLINSDDEGFGVSFDNDEVRCHKKLLEGESFYGLGEKSGYLRKNGNQYTMWNTDYPAYTSRKDPLYVSIPFFIGVKDYKAYGIYFDNTYKSYFNMGASSNRFYWFGADKGEMDYYFIYGPEIKHVVSQYTKLTGKMEMPPMWTLGYQQSRWSYHPEHEIRSVADNFRSRGIPCDVIYFDIHYMDGYRVFTWDNNRFPNPEKLLSDLESQGFKAITIIDPGVKADRNYHAAKEGLQRDLFAKYPDGTYYQGEVWPSWAYFPDFTKTETRQWWGKNLNNLLSQGIDAFWNDMNEPSVWGQAFPDIVRFDDNGFGASHKKIHNVYGLAMAKATQEAYAKYTPNKRGFIVTRAGFAGIQRYSAVWTGDNEATEEHLMLSCVMPQGLGLSGVAFTGPDAGGFIGEPTDRLYTRWMQLGAFTPFYRGHTEINTKAQEPWAFSETTERLAKESILMRYRYLPYLYNEFRNASVSGLPIVRTMFLEYQDDAECYAHDAQFQFMLGENLLAAPVLTEHDNFKKLYLPKGGWYGLHDSKLYEGGKWMTTEAPLHVIPHYLREGGVFVTQEAQQYVGEKEIEKLELWVYPAEESSYTFYEDDGLSKDYIDGEYSETEINTAVNNGTTEISIAKIKSGYDTLIEEYDLYIVSREKPGDITVNNNTTEFEYDENKKLIKFNISYEDEINISIK